MGREAGIMQPEDLREIGHVICGHLLVLEDVQPTDPGDDAHARERLDSARGFAELRDFRHRGQVHRDDPPFAGDGGRPLADDDPILPVERHVPHVRRREGFAVEEFGLDHGEGVGVDHPKIAVLGADDEPRPAWTKGNAREAVEGEPRDLRMGVEVDYDQANDLHPVERRVIGRVQPRSRAVDREAAELPGLTDQRAARVPVVYTRSEWREGQEKNENESPRDEPRRTHSRPLVAHSRETV